MEFIKNVHIGTVHTVHILGTSTWITKHCQLCSVLHNASYSHLLTMLQHCWQSCFVNINMTIQIQHPVENNCHCSVLKHRQNQKQKGHTDTGLSRGKFIDFSFLQFLPIEMKVQVSTCIFIGSTPSIQVTKPSKSWLILSVKLV